MALSLKLTLDSFMRFSFRCIDVVSDISVTYYEMCTMS
jgi:hypothetical protein